jgi:hypothetical protein
MWGTRCIGLQKTHRCFTGPWHRNFGNQHCIEITKHIAYRNISHCCYNPYPQQELLSLFNWFRRTTSSLDLSPLPTMLRVRISLEASMLWSHDALISHIRSRTVCMNRIYGTSAATEEQGSNRLNLQLTRRRRRRRRNVSDLWTSYSFSHWDNSRLTSGEGKAKVSITPWRRMEEWKYNSTRSWWS